MNVFKHSLILLTMVTLSNACGRCPWPWRGGGDTCPAPQYPQDALLEDKEVDGTFVELTETHIVNAVRKVVDAPYLQHALRLLEIPEVLPKYSKKALLEDSEDSAARLLEELGVGLPCDELASEPACPDYNVSTSSMIFNFFGSRITYFDVTVTNYMDYDDLRCVTRALGDGAMDLTLRFDMATNDTSAADFSSGDNTFRFSIGCTQAGTIHGKLRDLRVRCNRPVQFTEPLCYDCGCDSRDGLIPVCRNGELLEILFEDVLDGDTSPDCDTCDCSHDSDLTESFSV